LCNGRTAFRDIVRLAPSRASGAKILHALMACGLIEIPGNVPAEPEPDAAAAPTPAPQELEVEPSAPDAEARYVVARASYVRARQLMEARDFFGAIVLLEECVKLAPENPEYHYRLAAALSKNPRWGERTITQFKRALALSPNRQEALRDFAEFLLARNRAAEAREYAARLAEKYSEEPRYAELLARCEQGMGIAQAESSAPVGADRESRSLLGRLFRRGTPEG
jgi:predicted Zn-dependent protease